MLATTNWPLINTWIVSCVGLLTLVGILAASFRGRVAQENARAAQDTAKAAKDALDIVKVELEASNRRADRLEAEKADYKAERDSYRDKLHDENKISHAVQLENAVLKERTDFTPIEELLRKTSAESGQMNKQVLELIRTTTEMMGRISTVMERVEAKLGV